MDRGGGGSGKKKDGMRRNGRKKKRTFLIRFGGRRDRRGAEFAADDGKDGHVAATLGKTESAERERKEGEEEGRGGEGR